MATLTCSRGHLSDDSDFCSVCGIAMAAAGTVTGSAPAIASTDVCPVCQEPRLDPTARYCEVCRYDFVTGMSGGAVAPPDPPTTPDPSVVPQAASPDPASATASGIAVTTSSAHIRRDGGPWEVVVRVDPAQDIDPDPAVPCPVDAPERVFALVGNDAWLVGRRDAARGIFPDIPLEDNGASRRHLTLTWLPDGTLGARDEGSANGTLLAGRELVAGVAQPVEIGAEIRVGRWTVMTIRRRP